jgi:hypothetical protein
VPAISHGRAAGVTVAAGVLLGVVDLLLQKSLPYPWANLANSSAVWAVLAFGLGWALARSGGTWWRSALAGLVLLVLAVPSYYVTATVVQDDDLANAWAPTSLLWMVFGALAGPIFGAAGALARAAKEKRRGGGGERLGSARGGGWRWLVAASLPGAVLLAEAGLDVTRYPSTAVIKAALGVLMIVLVGRTWTALALALPLAAAGFAGFQVAGF